MSTKTTFKRIALVAVAALGFGVLTSVAPASAAAITPTAVTVGTVPTAQVGVVNTTPVTVTAPFTAGGSDTFSINVRVTSAPAGSAFSGLATAGTTAVGGGSAADFAAGVVKIGNSVAAKMTVSLGSTQTGLLGDAQVNADKMTIGYAHTSAGAATAPTTASFRVNLTPDVPGTYTILVSTNGSATAAAYVAGDANSTYTVTTGAAATGIVLSTVTGSSTKGSATGQMIKATLTGSLGLNETIAVTTNQTSAGLIRITNYTAYAADAAAASIQLTSAHFTSGVAYFLVNNSETETTVITATGSGLLSSAITSAISVTTRDAVVPTLVTMSDTAANVTAGGQAGHVGYTAGTDKASVAATSHSYLATVTAGTAGDYLTVTVADTKGKITGVVGATYTYALATATTTTATVSISATCATAGACFTATVDGTTDGVVAVTAEVPALSTVAVTGGTPTVVAQSHGGSTVINVIAKDQFRAAVANSVITVSTTGRNASTSNTTLATDASGRVSYTRTDAGTSATSNKQDVVTLAGTTGSATVTINYGTNAASTITCTSGAELDTATSVTYRDIASADGAEKGAASLCTVTVKDANGSVLVGVPVTVTTTSAGAAVLSTSATLYTGAAGTVAPSVYAWTAGAKTFTVTSGTATSTETVNYRQETAAEVRSISVVADGNRHLVTAKDRFGNVVPGVRIYGTRTGNGLFGGGAPTANAITAAPSVVDSNTGIAEFIFNAGSADSVVKYQVASAADTPSADFGYTAAVKGSSDDGTTALTASTVGTIYLAEAGVGASFDAAGVNSVTAAIAAGSDTAQAAVDAAAEATDAANAATDAANAAAEAADAATAAAQDAADAVAALSTQVSEMVSALKKQITALTNLVIKIQKKVRA
jgi:trimeric autotransporter adhesin